jgi:hypothetical protein
VESIVVNFVVLIMATTHLKEELSHAKTVGDVADVLSRATTHHFGEENVHIAKVVIAAIFVAIAVYVAVGVYRMLFASPYKIVKTAKSHPAKGKKGSKGKDEPVAVEKPASPQATSSDAEGSPGFATGSEQTPMSALLLKQYPRAPLKSERLRTPTVSECAPLKGIPHIGACAVSPDGFMLIVASREKRTVRIYPQFRGLERTAKLFKDFETISYDYVATDAIITHIAFAPRGGAFALLDFVSRHAFIFKYKIDEDTAFEAVPKLSHTFLRRIALPVVVCKSMDVEQTCLSEDANTLFFMRASEGMLEVVDAFCGSHIGSTKAKAGNSAVWGYASNFRFAAAGSYIHDLRIYQAQTRASGSAAVTLQKLVSISTLKCSQVALTPDGERAIIQVEGGRLQVYDLDIDFKKDDKTAIIADWRDSDYTDATALKVAYYHPRSGTMRRNLLVAIAKGQDFVVWYIPDAHNKEAPGLPTRVCEVFDAHDGEWIKTMDIACRGAAVATSADSDARNIVRLWPLNLPTTG